MTGHGKNLLEVSESFLYTPVCIFLEPNHQTVKSLTTLTLALALAARHTALSPLSAFFLLVTEFQF